MSKSSRAKAKLRLAELRWQREIAVSSGLHWSQYKEALERMIQALVSPIARTINYSEFINNVLTIKKMEDQNGK